MYIIGTIYKHMYVYFLVRIIVITLRRNIHYKMHIRKVDTDILIVSLSRRAEHEFSCLD